jgi:hypothetical protein
VRRKKEAIDIRERIMKFIIGASITLATTMITKLCVLIMNSESVVGFFDYIHQNYSFFWSIIAASITGGMLNQKETEYEK